MHTVRYHSNPDSHHSRIMIAIQESRPSGRSFCDYIDTVAYPKLELSSPRATTANWTAASRVRLGALELYQGVSSGF